MLGALALRPVDLHAQVGASRAAGLVVGSVDDTTGRPLPGVEIVVTGSRLRATTDSAGRFRLPGLRRGTHALQARRLGFEPVHFEVSTADGDTVVVAVELRAAAASLGTTLATVTTTADMIAPRLAEVGFENRRRHTGVPPSQFVTGADIARRNPVVLSQMLRTMSGRAQTCANGMVFLDGIRMGTPIETEVESRDTANLSRAGPLTRVAGSGIAGFDATPPPRAKDAIDHVAPSLVAGMEVYVGSAQIPPQYKTAGRANATASCVILIWTR